MRSFVKYLLCLMGVFALFLIIAQQKSFRDIQKIRNLNDAIKWEMKLASTGLYRYLLEGFVSRSVIPFVGDAQLVLVPGNLIQEAVLESDPINKVDGVIPNHAVFKDYWDNWYNWRLMRISPE